MKATRKHHYVPVFYQTHFANSNGLLWVYDRRAKTYKELHPRSICFENDLYSLRSKKGTPDRRVETQPLGFAPSCETCTFPAFSLELAADQYYHWGKIPALQVESFILKFV